MDIRGKNVFITGANRGIGVAYLDAFLCAGAKKVYAACREPGSLPEEFFQDLRVEPISLDLFNDETIQRVASTCADVDILVNNAGLFIEDSQCVDRIQNALDHMNTNYIGPAILTRALEKTIVKNRGAIINLTSIVAHRALPDAEDYSASKAALRSFTDSARLRLQDKGVLVMEVCPGPVQTRMFRREGMTATDPFVVAYETLRALQNNAVFVAPDAFARDYLELCALNPGHTGLEILAQMPEPEEEETPEPLATDTLENLLPLPSPV